MQCNAMQCKAIPAPPSNRMPIPPSFFARPKIKINSIPTADCKSTTQTQTQTQAHHLLLLVSAALLLSLHLGGLLLSHHHLGHGLLEVALCFALALLRVCALRFGCVGAVASKASQVSSERVTGYVHVRSGQFVLFILRDRLGKMLANKRVGHALLGWGRLARRVWRLHIEFGYYCTVGLLVVLVARPTFVRTCRGPVLLSGEKKVHGRRRLSS